uniref:Uncharacterized protein n=1 Tax=Anopheles quadriannulatus TaxID=34691 RepID=A0A182XQ69_ANOQN
MLLHSQLTQQRSTISTHITECRVYKHIY